MPPAALVGVDLLFGSVHRPLGVAQPLVVTVNTIEVTAVGERGPDLAYLSAEPVYQYSPSFAVYRLSAAGLTPTTTENGYIAPVLLVAVAGMAYVFGVVDSGPDDGPSWSRWVGVAVAGIFLAAMIWFTIA